MARKRDYKAEYQRRQALAKSRGFRSYGEQRRKIERGETRAIQPQRLRSRKTIENQTLYQRIFGEKTSGTPISKTPDSTEEFFRSIDVKAQRIDMAQSWSDWYSRSDATKFDAMRAAKDERYLSAYMQAFVLNQNMDTGAHHFYGDDALYEYLVEITEYFEADEYEDRYGEDS